MISYLYIFLPNGSQPIPYRGKKYFIVIFLNRLNRKKPYIPQYILKSMTESEILIAQERQLFLIEKMLSQKKMTLEELDHLLPALFHVNSPEDSSLIYVSQRGCDFLRFEREEILPFSAEQLAQINTADTLKYITPRFVDFYQEKDDLKVFSSYQQVVQRGIEGYTWVYTTTKIHKDLKAPFSISIPVPQMGAIAHQMSSLLEDNLFLTKNYRRFASLTKREREILAWVVQGEKRSHTAERLHMSLHTYDTHRKHIRQKLGTKSLAELVRYAKVFGMIEE
ncbi:MAG: LuxR family transcriptional regulator [Bacteroidetes bacterium]|nr:MAG: LuxR family transcriptional regulator [Bacteroidota bacterium]